MKHSRPVLVLLFLVFSAAVFGVFSIPPEESKPAKIFTLERAFGPKTPDEQWQHQVDSLNERQARTNENRETPGMIPMTNLTVLCFRGFKEWSTEIYIDSRYRDLILSLYPTNTWTNQTVWILKP